METVMIIILAAYIALVVYNFYALVFTLRVAEDGYGLLGALLAAILYPWELFWDLIKWIFEIIRRCFSGRI